MGAVPWGGLLWLGSFSVPACRASPHALPPACVRGVRREFPGQVRGKQLLSLMWGMAGPRGWWYQASLVLPLASLSTGFMVRQLLKEQGREARWLPSPPRPRPP